MTNYNFNETQITDLIKIIFTVSVCFAFLIIVVFNYYRNKFLTLTKK